MINIRSSASLIVVLFAVSVCIAQEPQPSSFSFTVSGAQPWTDTGIDLAPGDTLAFTSEINSGADCASATSTSADKLPLSSAPAGGLIAKTSDKSAPISAGSDIHVTEAGHLFLGINSAAAANCALTVKLTVTHGSPSAAPAPGMKDKLSTAAQTWLKGQFGSSSTPNQGQSSNAVAGSGSASGAPAQSAAGLNLPTVILDASLRKDIDTVPRRVHDAHGNLGDMVNFVIIGSQD